MWEIISGILGILGFLLSMVNLGILFFSRRKKLTICFDSYFVKKNYTRGDMIVVKYRFDNHSELPLSITRIQLVIGNKMIDIYSFPIIAAHSEYKTNNEVYHRNIKETDVPPLNLPPLGSIGGYLAFQVPRDTMSDNEKSLTFRICTNRGKAIQKTFALREECLCR